MSAGKLELIERLLDERDYTRQGFEYRVGKHLKECSRTVQPCLRSHTLCVTRYFQRDRRLAVLSLKPSKFGVNGGVSSFLQVCQWA